MSDQPDHPLVVVLRELGLRRNAAVGLLVGVLVAAVMYAYRVFELGGPAGDAGSPFLFVLLAFVLAVSSAALVAVSLTLWAAIRRVRS